MYAIRSYYDIGATVLFGDADQKTVRLLREEACQGDATENLLRFELLQQLRCRRFTLDDELVEHRRGVGNPETRQRRNLLAGISYNFV